MVVPGILYFRSWDHIFDIYEDSDGDEWIMTDKGVTIIGKKRINSDYPFKMVKEYNKRIYLISTSGKIAIYDPKNGNIKFQELPCPVTDIYSISSISPSNDFSGFVLIKEMSFIGWLGGCLYIKMLEFFLFCIVCYKSVVSS